MWLVVGSSFVTLAVPCAADDLPGQPLPPVVWVTGVEAGRLVEWETTAAGATAFFLELRGAENGSTVATWTLAGSVRSMVDVTPLDGSAVYVLTYEVGGETSAPGTAIFPAYPYCTRTLSIDPDFPFARVHTECYWPPPG